MRIVLDTNVLVSALLSPHGAPAQMVQLILAGRLQICHDARILDEYRKVLARPKFMFPRRDVDELLEFLESTGLSVVCVPLGQALPDAGDQPFLEAAIAGGADVLVTGNLRHFPARLRSGVRVAAPAEFLRGFSEVE